MRHPRKRDFADRELALTVVPSPTMARLIETAAIDFDPRSVRFMINSSVTKAIGFINGKI